MSDPREPDQDELRDAWETKRKRNQWCKCGYPDLPGSCQGPANCPMCQEDDGPEPIDNKSALLIGGV